MKKIIIAIDGFSSCGKSTMAKDLAREIGYIYIDSGAMYRAVTLYCIEQGLFDEAGNIDEETLKAHMNDIHISFQLNPETQRPVTYLNGVNVEDRIRSLEVSSHVSPVAALGFVREALVKQQQEMGKEKGIVMDGRDIGTAVFPEAELKIFVTASAEIRAQRRYDELEAKGQEVCPFFQGLEGNLWGKATVCAARGEKDVFPRLFSRLIGILHFDDILVVGIEAVEGVDAGREIVNRRDGRDSVI